MTAALLRRIAELEEFILQQKAAFAPRVAFPLSWKLDPRECAILSALQHTSGSYVTSDALLLCIAGFDEDQDEFSVRTWLARLRKKIMPLGIEIVTRPNQGYALTTKGRALVADALGQAVQVPQPLAAAPMVMHPRGWTDEEDAIVRQGYARGFPLTVIRGELGRAGHKARSLGSISGRAGTLGLGSVRRVTAWSPPEDEILSDGYEDGAAITEIRLRLAKAGFTRNRGAIQMRAIALGVSGGRVRTWSEPERRIVHHALKDGATHAQVIEQLASAGYERGRTAIAKMATSMGFRRADPEWKPAEDQRLGQLYAEKVSVRQIAKELGRPIGGIASRASKLGLLQRQPRPRTTSHSVGACAA